MMPKHTLKLLIFSLLTLLAACDRPPISVTIPDGELVGYVDEGVNQFYSIPYAKAPVGNLRWKAPQPPEPWDSPLDAKDIPPHCVQAMFGFQRGDEDCLYLNVYTADLEPETPLPVMVWIHGGGFIVGHSWETTPGHHLAREGNVVVVSINYRLGHFGFLAHPELSQRDGTSGNYGMLDQVHGLEWVKHNIRNFGGDPDNVTIFGESAGGMSVCNLLVSPKSKGLFHKAIIQSGPCYSPYPDLATMEQQGQELGNVLGCGNNNQLDCLLSATPEEVLDAMPPDPGMAFGEENAYWMPNLDGQFLTEQPWQSLESGNFHHVPVINGNNADEGHLIVMFGHEYRNRKVTEENYPDKINYLLRNPENVTTAMERYPTKNYPDAWHALAEVFSDHTFVCQEQFTTEAISRYAPVYSYYFTYPDADFIMPELRELGAFHSAELQFLFGAPMAWLETRFSGDEASLSRTMMQRWSEFARSGSPDDPTSDTAWPNYNENKQRLVIDINPSVITAEPDNDTCRFWGGIMNKTFIQ
jgi:para-nitrobenzyl esterase